MENLSSVEHLLAQIVTDQIEFKQIDNDQWSRIIDAALYHNLGPMLFHRIRHHEGLSFDFERLRQNVREMTIHFMAQDTARWEVNDVLMSSGITPIWIKGSALAHTIYEIPELRPMADLDLLVPNQFFERARAVLQYNGYQPSTGALIDIPPEFAVKHEHHIVLVGGAGGQIVLELHWRLLNMLILSTNQLDWFWDQIYDVEINNRVMTMLLPEAHLLYLCAHALLLHGAAEIRLISYFDIHLLIDKHEINWSIIIDQAKELKWSYTTESALRTTQIYFGTCIPEYVLEGLHKSRPSDELIWHVKGLAKKGNRFHKVWRMLQGESIWAQIRLILAILFPSRSYMRKRYDIPPGVPVWPSYIHRWVNQSNELWRTLW